MIAPRIEFSNLDPDTHVCTSHRQGDVITWTCPHCPGYIRTYNEKTGVLYVDRAGSTANHTGSSVGAAVLPIYSEN